MNWFERYGIVGIYYVSLSIGLLGIFTDFIDNWLNSSNVKSVAIIGAAVSLPVGYLISVLSQIIYYYCLPPECQVHNTACKNITAIKENSEKLLESYLAVEHRLYLSVKKSRKIKLENLKWLQEYVRKRWDVFAISSSMIVATVLAIFTFFIIITIFKIFELGDITLKNCSLFIPMLSVLYLIIIILLYSRQLMFDQIVEVYKELFKNLPHRSEESFF